ncbi:clavesin-1-like isoform X2 [Vanessa cardui]|uniref:clavesin-1-like isoform X1 n=1 Tax=Vanessa cardui TaxID=171605 RepID=UPI001F1456DF|nr:clavesin-1-like isoform X1 [Vanessa cardui]XP_046964464.1 clavesin-1-like isoform X2 [Vanessa cardui]
MTMSGQIQPFPVEKEYEKNSDISREDIEKLREWLKTQPHLPEEYITDLDLLLVYFCCEKSAEVSKQVLDLHFTLRTLLTVWFKDREVDKKVMNALNTALIAPLPEPTVNGYKAVYCRLIDEDPKRYMFGDIIRAFMMVFDLLQYEEGTWPGFVLLLDMDLASVGHLARIDISLLKQVLFFHQECMLIKLKELHFLNAPYFMDKVMMMLKPFMKKSLMDIIKVHERGSDSLYKYVQKNSFPKESGGKYKDNITLRDEIIRRLENNKQFFTDESRRRVNESLRPSGRKTIEGLFGIEGSFKKLDID